ncbi:hypothetical protein GMD88_10695 [Pseudoflavonifractor sp. BIOML-A6]|nr:MULTISPECIES: hypothetical protein [unclassified Pseudoflavonifractor]KAB4605889.1 hypothetical protein GA029_26315 [Bacteroides thetaiotaomicron]MTQ97469.1 hypothetical protein [Pseudoflavonifractor sp. BIOML-A16]MTR06569.1 hypothetical protein [Pseudoflavonifractor sp. BIOML-A15]MTR31950.1 hypothetical protein [Pseudoflavonifractor sp. BIOML-A14]MTR74062.1 hypothetical protein [Pseudoflavonifractor sp. BIOML-A18]MTS64501.1 hypothetical protein [Pseudoflavonifractor sp. BIOML-A5]MTS72683
MGQKTNLRSFRYSDEVAAILEAQEGKSVNDKFENLVLFCYYKVEQRQKDLDRINEDIRKRREELYQLSRETEQLHMLHQDLDKVKYHLEMAGRRAKNIADGTMK